MVYEKGTVKAPRGASAFSVFFFALRCRDDGLALLAVLYSLFLILTVLFADIGIVSSSGCNVQSSDAMIANLDWCAVDVNSERVGHSEVRTPQDA